MAILQSNRMVYLDQCGNVTGEEVLEVQPEEVASLVSTWIKRARKFPITASIDAVVNRPFNRVATPFGFDYSKLPSRNSKRHGRFSRK